MVNRIMRTGTAKDTVLPKTIEPDTTLREDGRFIRITTKLPDIAEEKIRIDIDIEKTTITIIAADSTKIYKKKITLPGDVTITKKRFHDGELHLTIEKKDHESVMERH
jgi:HSP20 family molecular chaperone IbpA